MIVNGTTIKKYRAKVKARDAFTTDNKPISADGYQIVEGYVSISAVIIPYGKNTPQYVPVFVAEEVDFHHLCTSGFGKSVFAPMSYVEGEFEIIGEVE